MMNLRRSLDAGPPPESEFASIVRNLESMAALGRVVSAINVKQEKVGPSEQYPISHVTKVDKPVSGKPVFFNQDAA